MLSGDCNVCINRELPSHSATCVECGLSRKNYKPMTNGDRIRRMTDEELAKWLDLLVNRAKIYGENKVWLEDTPRYYTDWLGWLKEEDK